MNDTRQKVIEPRTLALILGFSVGLGIAVHTVFFLAGGVILAVIAGERLLHAAGERWEEYRWAHHHA